METRFLRPRLDDLLPRIITGEYPFGEANPPYYHDPARNRNLRLRSKFRWSLVRGLRQTSHGLLAAWVSPNRAALGVTAAGLEVGYEIDPIPHAVHGLLSELAFLGLVEREQRFWHHAELYVRGHQIEVYDDIDPPFVPCDRAPLVRSCLSLAMSAFSDSTPIEYRESLPIERQPHPGEPHCLGTVGSPVVKRLYGICHRVWSNVESATGDQLLEIMVRRVYTTLVLLMNHLALEDLDALDHLDKPSWFDSDWRLMCAR